jgi:hypothetical protein
MSSRQAREMGCSLRGASQVLRGAARRRRPDVMSDMFQTKGVGWIATL